MSKGTPTQGTFHDLFPCAFNIPYHGEKVGKQMYLKGTAGYPEMDEFCRH